VFDPSRTASSALMLVATECMAFGLSGSYRSPAFPLRCKDFGETHHPEPSPKSLGDACGLALRHMKKTLGAVARPHIGPFNGWSVARVTLQTVRRALGNVRLSPDRLLNATQYRVEQNARTQQ
jgi:hypothetical protein